MGKENLNIGGIGPNRKQKEPTHAPKTPCPECGAYGAWERSPWNLKQHLARKICKKNRKPIWVIDPQILNSMVLPQRDISLTSILSFPSSFPPSHLSPVTIPIPSSPRSSYETPDPFQHFPISADETILESSCGEYSESPNDNKPYHKLSDCSMCFEGYAEADSVSCSFCPNNIHKKCFKVWPDTRKANRQVICVQCQSKWYTTGIGITNNGGYMNIGSNAIFPESHSLSV